MLLRAAFFGLGLVFSQAFGYDDAEILSHIIADGSPANVVVKKALEPRYRVVFQEGKLIQQKNLDRDLPFCEWDFDEYQDVKLEKGKSFALRLVNGSMIINPNDHDEVWRYGAVLYFTKGSIPSLVACHRWVTPATADKTDFTVGEFKQAVGSYLALD